MNDAIFALFSDQSTIHYVEKIGSKYPNFLQMILHENLKTTDFKEYQVPAINKLIYTNYLYLNENGYIKPVSYTHLDVYKRQTISRADDGAYCGNLPLGRQEEVDYGREGRSQQDQK